MRGIPDMARKIRLDPEQMTGREKMSDYFMQLFQFEEYFGRNLDALNDCLSEVDVPTDFVVNRAILQQILNDEYAYKVFRVISEAVRDNPALHIVYK